MSVLDLVQQQLGPAELQQLSEQIGADPAQTKSALDAAVPMLLGGMAGSAQQPGGAQNVAAAMQEHMGLAGGLGGLGAILGGLAGGGGGGILGQILGHQEPAVQNGVQQASGLDSAQVKKLLMLVAPIVLAALARRRQQTATTPNAGADLDGDGIPDALQQEARQAQASAAPHIGGIVGKILESAMRH